MAAVRGRDWSSAASMLGIDVAGAQYSGNRPDSGTSITSGMPLQVALKALFNQYDHQLEGYLTAGQLQELFNSLRDLDELTGTSLSVQQAEATISACCAADTCELAELTACIRELDRRLEILRNVRWEFDFLDAQRRGLVSEEQARFLFHATHNERFSSQQFNDFIRSRPRQGSAISFEEIEVEICKIPSVQQVLFEAEEVRRKEQARVEKAQKQANARRAEEEQLEMSLRIAALARVENERREKEARAAARHQAIAGEEKDKLRQEANEKQMRTRFRKRKLTIDLHMEQREMAAKARETRTQVEDERKAKALLEEEARQSAERQAKEEADRRLAERRALEEEQERQREEEARKRAQEEAKAQAEEDRKRREEDEKRIAKEKAEADKLARQHAEEETQHAAQREADAIAEAEAATAALATATDEESKAAALSRQNQAKQRAREACEKRVRGNLKVAVKSRKLEQLEPAVKEAEAVKPDKEEWPELTEAQHLLRQLRAAMDLKGALTGRKLAALQAAAKNVRKSGCESELAREMAEAASLISKLEKLARQKKEIMDMKGNVISELRSYSNPPTAVHKVLIATFLLLGVKEKETKNWQSIQALMGKTGKESLKRRVGECEPHTITMDTVQRVRRQVHGLDVLSVGEISATAATFALWVETMVEEAESHHKQH